MTAATLLKAARTALGRPASVALAIACVWAIGLVVAGLTLVDANGPGVAVVLAIPLAVTILVGCLLLRRRRRWALPVAWTLTGLLAVFTLLAMASIGLFVVPVTACLIVACGTARLHSETARSFAERKE